MILQKYREMTTNRSVNILYSLIMVGIVFRILLIFGLPLGQTVNMRLEGLNDEPSHFNYVKYLATYKQFPVQKMSSQDTDAFVKNEFEYYQPPVYYLLCAPAVLIFSENTALIISRLISFFFGLLTVYFTYKLIRIMGYSHTGGLFASALLMLMLSPSYFSSVCSNDSLSWLFPVLFLYFLLKINSTGHLKMSTALQLGIFLGLSILTKSSNLCLFMFTGVIAVYHFIRHEFKKSRFWILTIITGLLFASPWYIRNFLIYKSVLAMSVGFGPAQIQDCPLWYNLYIMFRSAIKYFWFPMQHVQASTLSHLLELSGLFLICIYTIIFVYWLLKFHKFWQSFPMLTLLLISIAAYVNLQLKWSNPEGRYLFSALFPIVFILTIPVIEVLNFRSRPLQWLLLSITAVFPYLYFITV